MISLRSRSQTTRRHLSNQHNTLSVSWLRKRFRAVAITRGQVTGVWEPPEPVEGTDRFADLLRQAVQATGYHGSTVSLVLAHQHLVHLLVEVPPVKRGLLEKVVNRQAQQQRLFSGQAVWSIEVAESAKKGPQQFLLNLFPKMLLDELIAGCTKAGCFLTAVVPPPAVLRNQLFELPTPDTQVTMIAALTGESTTVLVGRSDGRVLLARVLTGNWIDSLPRMLVDLKRTILFVNQQNGANVESLWLYGQGAVDCAGSIQAQLGLPTQASPTPYHDDYWAVEPLKIEDVHSQNLISREQRKAPQRRILAKVVAAATALTVAAAATASWQLHRMLQEERQTVMRLEREVAKLSTRHQELQTLHAEVALQKRIVQLVAEGRPPPVPAWVLGYLREAVPPELVVTNLAVRREGQHWHLSLAGRPQPGRAPAPVAGQTRSTPYAELTNRLASGPLHMRFHRPTTGAVKGAGGPSGKPTNAAPATVASWLTRIGTARPATASTSPTEFTVEGWVQP